ncbi:Glutathione transport system permease protein gsiC [Serratia fonticola]|uniref:ABC transporter permease n=1 Tax=Serratia fonticola TaxID=47917 RepID=UPI00217A102D|nr:ABC transporter permease [Serratia fonticola]CAI0820089.1 Glutathione transport system permease protein gsiC [Serratia fonticola]
MLKYLSGRTGQALLVLWAAFTLSFILLQVLPGDAILIKFQNPDMGLSPAQIADMRAAYGADVPLWQQYLHTLGNFLRGDLGYSIQNGVPVSALLAANLPATLQLAVLGFTLALLLALVIAFVSNLIGFGWLKSALQSLPALFVSVPTFWLGIVLIQIFSFRLKLVPIINPGEWVGLLLPIATLAIPISAPLAQILIRSIDSVQTQPFVAVARAKGASRSGVLWRHVARNAMLPVLTIAGILFGELIAGALITETVFGRSGLGQVTQQAVVNQDVAVLQAVVMISAAAFVFLNLLVDLLFPLLDPRLKSYAGATR